ncbi:MAG: serine/threonine-protein kinase [Polyangiales bacterium]
MTDPDSQKTLAPGTLVGGKLRVLKLLGEGGMGAVYEVQHEITKHRRALKLLHADVRKRHPQVVQRFLREASVAGTLGDPHIVETFDAGELPSGEPYLVMELLEGESLAARIAHGRPDIAEVVDIAIQVCTAMEVAHGRGIVHRDLKPENLFLCQKPAGFVKVLDFGISKFDAARSGVDGASQTQEGAALGTPYYMPPEQVRGALDIDARADVYAIGVILYEALTGRRPFDAPSMPHLMVLIHEGKPHPLRTLRAEVSSELAAVVARAMCADRDQRTPTAAALRTELEGLVTANRLTESDENVALDVTALGVGSLGPVPPTPYVVRVVSQAPVPGDPLAQTELTTAKTMLGPEPTPATRRGVPVSWIVAALVIGGVGLGGLALMSQRHEQVPGTATSATTVTPSSAPSSSAIASTSAATTTTASASAVPSASVVSSATASTGATSKPAVTATATTTTATTATTKPPPSASAKPLPSGLAGNPF